MSLTIGQVAKRSNVNLETVRYYERLGLIKEPPRTEAGYRMFPADVVDKIKFIKRAQELGFTLSEIKKLIRIAENEEHFTAHEVHQFAKQKLDDLEAKIRDLEKMKSVLQDLSERCSGKGPICDCPIIQSLSQEGES
ncbi:MerR family mercuric resistance operon transcriptional regulator [Caldalkalibacillus uzonensis]|uniref:Mercuric resistance operon regulatory protein n=1 Tax=Caldalkalibacillus uzonensis TaxID=353224 RepID=A0ABU0CVJ3_9BACI|nr:MerR family DNA-binding protein [Caldalkalibacillus uzonensis]MDQ0339062.1 MerR family mercuric resistance operon transcriptional regulator [Caldalkalibacillus uzonensis]